MKKFTEKVSILKEKYGYISVETVIVAGLMIGLGVFAISNLYGPGQDVIFASTDRVFGAMDLTVDAGLIP